MDSPHYTATITSYSRGWTTTAVEGVEPDLDNTAIRTFLAAPLVIKWSFLDETIPNPLDPTRITFTIWARTAADLPVVELGDLITADVKIGAAGPSILMIPLARCAEPVVELVAGDPWAARLTVTASDMLVDLGSKFPPELPLPGTQSYDPSTQPNNVRERWAVLGQYLSASIGCPTTWPATTFQLRRNWGGDSAATVAQQLLNTPPVDEQYALVPTYTNGGGVYPAGYHYVGTGVAGVADPVTWNRYIVTPLARAITGAAALPLAFVKVGALLTVRSVPSSSGTFRPLSLDAGYCRVPTTAARRRNHLINTVRIKGVNLISVTPSAKIPATSIPGNPNFAMDDEESETEHTNAADVSLRGNIGRELDTQFALRAFFEGGIWPVRAYIPPRFEGYFADATARAAGWAYDEIEVYASDMPQTMAAAVLPYLAPSVPGDGRDGRILRQVTLHRLAAEARLPGVQVSGFIVAGELTLDGGEIRYRLTTAPGGHTYSAPPTPITVGEAAGGSYATTTIANIDRAITVADTVLIDT